MHSQKNLMFEYFVFLLEKWKTELKGYAIPTFTKLRLQKLLFLACTINATEKDKKLLSIFDRFNALPYGPVELDIYEAMKRNSFTFLSFEGNYCTFKNEIHSSDFDLLIKSHKKLVDEAVYELKRKRQDYLSMPIFDLVEITHQWTAWQTAMAIADLLGNKSEEMTVIGICNSRIKAY